MGLDALVKPCDLVLVQATTGKIDEFDPFAGEPIFGAGKTGGVAAGPR